MVAGALAGALEGALAGALEGALAGALEGALAGALAGALGHCYLHGVGRNSDRQSLTSRCQNVWLANGF